MIKKIEAKDRYLAKHDWLSSYHLFSFADYYDPSNMNFGGLRVFNDDAIDAENGFGKHGHRDMEIVTIMLDGELTHEDSMGNTATMVAGEVQYMSAGTGVMHSEVNNSKHDTHLYQIWIIPKQKSLTPRYAQKNFNIKSRKNILVPAASDLEKDGAININADATIYLADFDADKRFEYKIESNRGVFIYVTRGGLEINGTDFKAGDQARIEKEESLIILAKDKVEFILIDVALQF